MMEVSIILGICSIMCVGLIIVGLWIESENVYIPSFIMSTVLFASFVFASIIENNIRYEKHMNVCTKTISYYECKVKFSVGEVMK